MSEITEALTEIEAAEARLVAALAEIEQGLPARLAKAADESAGLRAELKAAEEAWQAAETRADRLAADIATLLAANGRLAEELKAAESGNRDLRAAAAAMARRVDSAIGQVRVALN